MVFDGHDPTLHLTVDIFLPHGSHINEINLKTIAELRLNDWLLSAFLRLDDRSLLVANVAILTVNLAELIGWAVERWLTSGECLVNSQVTLLTMSLLDDIKNIEHVENDATTILVLKYHLQRTIESFGLL